MPLCAIAVSGQIRSSNIGYPRQQIAQPVHWLVLDSDDAIMQLRFWVNAGQPAGADEGIEHGGVLTAYV